MSLPIKCRNTNIYYTYIFENKYVCESYLIFLISSPSGSTARFDQMPIGDPKVSHILVFNYDYIRQNSFRETNLSSVWESTKITQSFRIISCSKQFFALNFLAWLLRSAGPQFSKSSLFSSFFMHQLRKIWSSIVLQFFDRKIFFTWPCQEKHDFCFVW